MRELRPRDDVAGYRVEAVAGRGGMGLVYRARQRRPDRVVAIKVIAPELATDPEFRKRFEQECASAAQIEHPNVIPVYAVGEDAGLLYIAMRFVQGVDLGCLLAQSGRLEARRAAGVVAQVAAALDAAHAHGLVHRDVNPGNVLVTARDHVYLTDFGITKRTTDASGMTKTGMLLGTLAYIAPEQIEGQRLDGRADVYALGCVTYQLLSGSVPFPRASAIAVAFAHIHDAPPRLAGTSAPFADAVQRAMAKRPDDRFATAGDFGRAILAGAARETHRSLIGSAPARTAAIDREGISAASPAELIAGARLRPSVVRLPLPAALRGVLPTGYVGRAEQHELVGKCWNAARRGLRHAVLISGEPGIGKTQFSVRAAHEFHGAGALVMFGRCPEELSAPYAPWIQALSPFVEHAPDQHLTAYVERFGGELARIVPTLARRMPQTPAPKLTDPESERYLLFSAVVGLLEQASTAAPVVLLLDDLHWADRTTLALLKHLIAETGALRLLVLATHRDSDLSSGHPLPGMLADLRREQRIERLQLPGLGEQEVVALMQEALGHETNGAGAALARDITAETGGNPFFATELVRHLSESGALTAPQDRRDEMMPQLAQIGLPQSVLEVVVRRVDRLGEDHHRALSCAAVIGPRFSLDLLARVVQADEEKLIDLLQAAIDACLLEERSDAVGSFAFAHDLINHALYEALGATRRARIHRRVAQGLESLSGGDAGPRIEELARHWMAAAPPDARRAQAYCRQAGEQALAKLAPDEAVRWLGNAIKLLETTADPDPQARCELSIGLGEAQRQAGRAEFRATLLGAARLAEQIHDADRMARAALANSRGFASAFGTVDRERVAVLERAVELNRVGPPARSARLLALQAMELQFDSDHQRRRALADEALALAREGGDERSLSYVLRDHFHATWSVDTLDARRRTAQEMRDLAAQADDPLVRIWALDRTIHVNTETGQLIAAGQALAQLQTLTEQLGQPGLRWHATYYAAGLAHARADLNEAPY